MAQVHRSPYQSRRHARPNGNGNGRSFHGHARRIALARVRGRARPRGTSLRSAPLVALVVVGGIVAGGLVSALVGTAAATSVINSLEARLPDVSRFEQLQYAQPSIIYDRTGKIELARFQVERRRVVNFEAIPRVLLDATIATEDRTFWTNDGIDPKGIASAALQYISGQAERGASTITQQFVRARLLPDDALGGDLLTRKVMEILQAQRLTAAYPGDQGKQRIITAYLNQIYYGHNAYGVAAAAEVYFGVTDLNRLTVAQAALLAGLPQAPDYYDLYRWAVRDDQGRLVVPTTSSYGEALSPPVERRNFILNALYNGYGRWTHLSAEQLEAAVEEPIVLPEAKPQPLRAPQFVFAVKAQLDDYLASTGREPLERGGYRVITTLDWNTQLLAEKWITAATVWSQLPEDQMQQLITDNGLDADRDWLLSMRDTDIHNGALVALDAKSGDILGYVGSAGYYLDDMASPEFDPKFDVAGLGWRQPGSAWKPVEYAVGLDQKVITPGTLLIDNTTEFIRQWRPSDFDRRERGPVLMRQALVQSLNVPVIRALARIGVDQVSDYSARLGLTFPRGPDHLRYAGLAGAIGTVETNLVQLTGAFGTMANGGVKVEPRRVLEVLDQGGLSIYKAPAPSSEHIFSPQAAWLISDVLKDLTDPVTNPGPGGRLAINNGPNGERRVAAAKTGTTDDKRDLSTYGYLPPPVNPNNPQPVVGVWLGNSDHSAPQGGDATFLASNTAARVWSSFVRELSNGWAVNEFPRPNGLTQATIDAWSGGKPGPWTRDTTQEWFISGTEPDSKEAIDPAGLLYRQMCGGWFVDLTKVERDAPQAWQAADADWMARARRGTGIKSDTGTRTAYLPGREDWGGPLAPTSCPTPAPRPTASPPPDGQPTPAPPGPPGPPGPPEPTKSPKPPGPPQPSTGPAAQPAPSPTPSPAP
jgi:membrane peptidoglycan carboxypeptidase